MTTAERPVTISAPDTQAVPAGAVGVRPEGLLASVRRPCPQHPGPECCCVARRPDERCLVFWCPVGGHHFSAR